MANKIVQELSSVLLIELELPQNMVGVFIFFASLTFWIDYFINSSKGRVRFIILHFTWLIVTVKSRGRLFFLNQGTPDSLEKVSKHIFPTDKLGFFIFILDF